MLNGINYTVLILFFSSTLLLMLATLTNRLRVRRILFTWPTGVLAGMPLLPTLFMTVIVGLLSFTMVTGHQGLSVFVLGLYLVGGLFWYVSALLSQSVVVTEYGIICNVNRMGHSVGWGQIVDYVEIDSGKKSKFVFFYMDDAGHKQRMELEVPDRTRYQRFSHVVRSKLDSRFYFSTEQAYGRKAMNQ